MTIMVNYFCNKPHVFFVIEILKISEVFCKEKKKPYIFKEFTICFNNFTSSYSWLTGADVTGGYIP